jgi:putative nucleotidyltransferase with HDIG domain
MSSWSNKDPRKGNLPWAHLRLPPFPQVATRVLQLVNRENVQLHQLAELISSDPAFASEVLTVANSPLYPLHYHANSIMQAVAILGGNALQGMCITVGVRAYLGKSMNLPAMRVIWRHNLASAVVAQQIAAGSKFDKDTAFTAGILHDIGRTALSLVMPKEYAELLSTHRGSNLSMMDGERDLFGVDHCEAGLQLICDWKLPSEFNTVVSEHHQPILPGTPWSLAELIKVSCAVADSIGYPCLHRMRNHALRRAAQPASGACSGQTRHRQRRLLRAYCRVHQTYRVGLKSRSTLHCPQLLQRVPAAGVRCRSRFGFPCGPALLYSCSAFASLTGTCVVPARRKESGLQTAIPCNLPGRKSLCIWPPSRR